MKKILAHNVLLGFILFAVTGCLKDTGYDEQKYGTDIKELKAVAFPQAAAKEISTGLTSSTTPVTVNGPLITLEQDGFPTSAVNVGVQTNNNLVTAAGYTLLPTGSYTVNLTTIQIPAGKKTTDTLKITFPNTSLLDPTTTYAIGFTIGSVDQGYKIAANQKQVLFTFTVKNIYDGVYEVVSGSVRRYTNPSSPEALGGLNGNLAGNPDIFLITVGPNSLKIPVSGETGALFWANGSNSQVAGIDNLRIAVDPATNLVTMSSLGNASLANWEMRENKYDPATRTFTLNFRWNPTANRREYSVVLKYRKPRG